MVERFALLAHPELPLPAPVFTWQPGDPDPHYGQLAYRLASRWTEPHRPLQAVIATPAAAAYFGGHGGKRPKRVEENHDVHLAAVYLRLRSEAPEIASTWKAESAIRRTRPDAPGEKLPDATVIENGIAKVIDFGGSYSAEKLAGFHRWAVHRERAYELW
jgi:hypothetical protein